MGGFGRKAALCCMIGTFTATAWPCDLFIPDIDIAPGATVPVPVVLAPGNAAVAAVQFDLQYDPAALAVSFVPGGGSRAAAKTIYSSASTPGVRRFVIVGLSSTPIEAGDLVRLFVTVRSDAAAGSYQLGVYEQACADSEGNSLAGGARPATITARGAQAGTGLAIDGVLNAASLLNGPVSPGELITVMGNGLAAPDGSPSTVYFDDLPAHVMYQGPSQLNVIVPDGVIGPRTIMRVNAGNTLRGQADLSVVEMAPAVFTQDASGIGAAVALNEDGSLNGPLNPAARGSVLTVFVTGLRPSGGLVDEGTAILEPVPDVMIDGTRIPVLSIALSGDIPGVFVARFRIPVEALSSPESALILNAGEFATQAGVSIAIR